MSTSGQVQTARINRKAGRSCVICHKRKVRCDKRLPCSTCTRGGVLCRYPAGDKPAPRQPKSTIADIASRLVQLEKTIIALSGDANKPTNSSADYENTSKEPKDGVSHVSDQAVSPSAGSSAVDELLVEHGSSSRYINELLLSRVLEEEHEMQSAMATPRQSESETQHLVPTIQPFNLLDMPANISPVVELKDLHPPLYQAMQLWNIFVQNVDPVNKFLHIPTAQVDVFTAMNNENCAQPDMHCFLFSVFFAATTALSPNDVTHLLGQDKKTALMRFKHGLEQSLAQANILETPSLKALQAIGLFLTIHRAHNPGRSTWILSGLAIRAAQSIGLHRDGTNFKLSPFETEIRRRLWWYLVCHDGRAGEDHGITISSADHTTDVQLPLNINDSDIYPSMDCLPQEQSRWTEMTISLNMYEISKTMRQWRTMHHNTGSKPNEQKRKELLEQLTTRVERLLQHCNPVVPIQRLTVVISRIVLRKHDFISRLPWLSGVNPRETLCSEETLESAIDILELNLQVLDAELLRNYSWIGEIYPQYYTLLYVLWHLGLHPVGPNADRAWIAVNGSFEQESARQRRQAHSGSTSKWVVLTMLRDRAARARKMACQTQPSEPAITGGADDVNHTIRFVPDEDASLMDTIKTNMSWDSGFVDWNFLIEEFHNQEFEVTL